MTDFAPHDVARLKGGDKMKKGMLTNGSMTSGKFSGKMARSRKGKATVTRTVKKGKATGGFTSKGLGIGRSTRKKGAPGYTASGVKAHDRSSMAKHGIKL